jgi:hypothetical protein
MATGRVPTTANSPLTAKGDLFGYSTTQARVAVGNDGETLVADSSTSTGLRYTAGTVQANPVLNSAFQVWQRGTSVSGAGGGAYTADRWFVYAGGQATVSRQTTGDTTNLPFIQYCARVQRNSGSTDTSNIPLSQSFETINSLQYAGKTVTFSFYARRGANYSATSNALLVYLITGTGTDQNQQTTGYTGTATPINGSTATLTTTWQRFTYTATLASNITELSLNLTFIPTGTAGAADFFEVTGVQLDVGSVALPFRTNGATIQGELAACQRYYLVYATDEGTRKVFGSANYYSATQVNAVINFPVQMRTAPTLSASSGTDYYGVDRNGGVDYFNSLTIFRPSPLSCMLYNSSEASGTAGNAGVIFTNNSLTVVALSAEL